MWALLGLIVLWSFGPILIAVVSSFKLEKDIFTYVPKLAFEPVLNNYQTLATDWPKFWGTLRTSIAVTLSAAAVVVIVSLPAAYAYSRLASRAVSLTALFLIGVRMFPPIVITIPLFPLFTDLGLVDTPFALVLIYATFQVSMSVLLLKVFIDSVPRELEEAAWLDGCGRTQAFVFIMIPLIFPGIAAAIIFVMLFAWNDFLFAFLLTGSSSKTAPVQIAEMLGAVGDGGVDWGVIFAAASIQLLPMLLFVWLIQKPMLRGFTSGALKG